MLKSAEIRRQVAQRLREIFVRARGWEETPDARVGNQTADLLVKFRLGEHEQTLVVDVTSLGQPRQIRAAVTKLSEVRRAWPAAYPVAASVYIAYLLEIIKLANPRIRRREEQARDDARRSA